MKEIIFSHARHAPSRDELLAYMAENRQEDISSATFIIILRKMARGLKEGEKAILNLSSLSETIKPTKIEIIKSKRDEVLMSSGSLASICGVSEEELNSRIAGTQEKFAEFETFTHPLSEACPKDPNYINLWAFASMIVNAILNPDATNDGGLKAAESASQIILQFNPLANVSYLIEQVRRRYRAEAYQLCNMLQESLDYKSKK